MIDTSDAPASQEFLKASRIISLGSLKSFNNMNFQEEFSYRLDDIFGNDIGRALWSNVEWSEEAVIPIPAALPLLLSGLAGLGLIGWRRRKTT